MDPMSVSELTVMSADIIWTPVELLPVLIDVVEYYADLWRAT